MQVVLLSLGPGLPLLIALGLMWSPLRKKAYGLVPLAAMPALVTALFGPSQVAVAVPWFFMGGMMGLDPIGRTFLFFTALLWLAAALFSRGSLANDHKRYRCSGYFLVTMSGNFGLILAQEFLGFYLFFSLMSFAAYGLVVHRETREAFRAGRIYLVLTVLGEVMLFVALLLIVRHSGSSAFVDLRSGGSGTLLFTLLFVGFGIKAGALPLHVWLPLAHPVAPAPASAVLSGAMIKAGLLGWIRFLPHDAIPASAWGAFFIVGGLSAVVYGVVVGLTQKNAKTVLAYSSISQMGFMAIMIGCGLRSPENWAPAAAGAALYALHHGLAKGCLFLGAGLATAEKGKEGMAPWWLIAGLWMASLALAGLPFTSGAIAKSVLKEVVAGVPGPLHDVISLFLPIGAACTMALLVHFLDLVGAAKGDGLHGKGMMRFAWALLLVAVVVGMWLWPGSSDHAVHSLAAESVWSGLWPVMLGVCCGMIWVRLGRESRVRRLLFVPPGDILEFCVWLGGESEGMRQLTRIVGKRHAVRPAPWQRRVWIALHLPARVGRTEKVLQRWAVVGSLYLLVFLVLVCFFSGGLRGFL